MNDASLAWSPVLAFALASFGLAACGPESVGSGSSEDATQESSSGDGDGDGDGELATRDVDLVIVLDNSGSMGTHQAQLARSIGVVVDALDEAGANYRIGITTTEIHNPACAVTETAWDGGRFVLSSCKQRLDHFMFGDLIDARDLACNEVCGLDDAQLEIQPSVTHVDDDPAPRAWVESIDGDTNLPPGTGLAEALGCFVPMGIDGCGFESQLESTYLAVIRSQTEAEPNQGFFRPGSVAAFLIVTDEADCSRNKLYNSAFMTSGNKTFWSDPTADAPTSAACWNAGVSCSGDPGGYDGCATINKSITGNEGVSDEEAVLQPVSRYLDFFTGLEASMQRQQPGREIVVGLIGGVGSDGTPVYADASDPGYQLEFGIGPGCTASDPNDPSQMIQAVPPVRLHELVEAVSPGTSTSICAQDLGPGLASFAAKITTQLP